MYSGIKIKFNEGYRMVKYIPNKIKIKNTNELLNEIVCQTAEKFNVSASEILSHSRERLLVDLRSAIYYFVRSTYPSITWKSIGGFFNRDHATIINGFNNAANFIKTDSLFANFYLYCENEIFTPIQYLLAND